MKHRREGSTPSGSHMSDQIKRDPPPGFRVGRASDFDPLFGDRNRWAFHGTIGDRTVFASGISSEEFACAAAWEAFG